MLILGFDGGAPTPADAAPAVRLMGAARAAERVENENKGLDSCVDSCVDSGGDGCRREGCRRTMINVNQPLQHSGSD
jgi:hypothetical protein